MPNSLLALVMILKDEGETIARTIESCRDHVDRIVILDTGSTDNTVDEVVRSCNGVRCEIYVEPFIDFATTRNRALELAGKDCIFHFMLSGGERLINGENLRKFCERNRELHGVDGKPNGGAYLCSVRLGDNLYDSARLSRSEAAWTYRGVTHELLLAPDGGFTDEKIPDVLIVHEKDSSTEKQRKRWELDAELLLTELRKNPADSRSCYYLAQSHECLGNHEKAYKYYVKRSGLGGWDEEIFLSKLRSFKIGLKQLQRSNSEFVLGMMELYDSFPHRAETLYELAWFYHDRKKDNIAHALAKASARIPLPKKVSLAIEYSVYSWRVHDLVARTCGEDAETGYRAAKIAFSRNPENEWLKNNLANLTSRLRPE